MSAPRSAAAAAAMQSAATAAPHSLLPSHPHSQPARDTRAPPHPAPVLRRKAAPGYLARRVWAERDAHTRTHTLTVCVSVCVCLCVCARAHTAWAERDGSVCSGRAAAGASSMSRTTCLIPAAADKSIGGVIPAAADKSIGGVIPAAADKSVGGIIPAAADKSTDTSCS
jgi:hypothetical protein